MPCENIRIEALHVIEDAPRTPEPRVMRSLRQARNDPDPSVADTAARYLQECRSRHRRIREGRYMSADDREHLNRRRRALCDEAEP